MLLAGLLQIFESLTRNENDRVFWMSYFTIVVKFSKNIIDVSIIQIQFISIVFQWLHLCLCFRCLLATIESSGGVCVRSSGGDGCISFHIMSCYVSLFLKNRTWLSDKIKIQCTTKECNSLENWK
jgi:hypothetical protein